MNFSDLRHFLRCSTGFIERLLTGQLVVPKGTPIDELKAEFEKRKKIRARGIYVKSF